MTRSLAVLYGLCILVTVLAFAHVIDPEFVRELGDFVVWMLPR